MNVTSIRQRRGNPRATYASKDYIEQLRTVHFALLSITAGLLLLSLSVRPYDSRRAVMEMEGIIKLMAVWSPGWVCDHQSRSLPLDERCLIDGDRYEIPISDKVGNKGSDRVILKVTKPDQRHFKPLFARLKPPSEKQFAWLETKPLNNSLDNIPDSLDKFAMWWKELGSSRHRFAVAGFVSSVCVPVILGVELNCEVIDEGDLTASDKLILKNLQNVPTTEYTMTHFRSGPRQSVWINIITDGFPYGQLTRLDSSSFWQGSVSQDDVLDLFPGSVRGDFKDSFPDLYQATLGIQSLDFDRISKYLQANNSTSSEVFEAFGLKIPAEQVTGWGTIVILSIQLYLFIYLRGLKRPLKPTDSGWDVGWFGINQDGLSRTILFVTISILPAFSVVQLARHALDQRLKTISLRLSWSFVSSGQLIRFVRDFPAALLILLGCCLSLFLCYVSWKARPLVAETPFKAGNQLFE